MHVGFLCGLRFTKLFWLRSGRDRDDYSSQYLTASGAFFNTYGARRFSVRPALHCPVWLRSGYPEGAYVAQYLTASGMPGSAYPVRLLAVRPALRSAVYERKKYGFRIPPCALTGGLKRNWSSEGAAVLPF